MNKENSVPPAETSGHVSTTKLSLVASLSALYLVFRLIPTFPMFGVPGVTFRAGDMVAPLYGIVLGPLLGPLAIILGTTVGFFTGAPPVFLGLDFLPAVCCAGVVGLAVRGKRLLGSMVYSGLILLFVLLPYAPNLILVGGFHVPYVWLHLFGLALYVSPFAGRAARLVRMDHARNAGPVFGYLQGQFASVLVLAFAGTLAQHIMGGTLTQLVIGIGSHQVPGRPGQFHTWQDFWTLVFWAYPFERSAIALIGATIGGAALIALKASRLTHRLSEL